GERKISSSPDREACRHGICGGRRPLQPRVHYLNCAVARPAEMKGDGLRFWNRMEGQSGHNAEVSGTGPAQRPIEIIVQAGITGDHGAVVIMEDSIDLSELGTTPDRGKIIIHHDRI